MEVVEEVEEVEVRVGVGEEEEKEKEDNDEGVEAGTPETLDEGTMVEEGVLLTGVPSTGGVVV